MTSASIVTLNPQQHVGTFSTPPLDSAAAAKASELLQTNHEKFHMYFSSSGFHNHIAHHMLALYAFNAPPQVMERQFDDNAPTQWAMKPVDQSTLQDLEDSATFSQHLSKRDHYHDFLVLFENEIQKHGVRASLEKYLFAGDARSKDMMNRLYAGILHPIIHLGYGLEWQQPAIVAEALAMTATHDAWPSALYDAVSPLLPQHQNSRRTLWSLTQEAAKSQTIRASPNYNDDLRVRDGVLGRAGAEIAPLCAQWSVGEENLTAKIAEVANYTCAMVFGGQRAGKPFRVDFTLMHCANSIPLVAATVESPDVPQTAKVELLQRVGQYSLITYVAQGSPDMKFELLRQFKPEKEAKNWEELTERCFRVSDDGHVIKLLRALRFAEKMGKEAGEQEGYLLKGDDWLKAGNMLVHIAERNDSIRFVRGSGFDVAW